MRETAMAVAVLWVLAGCGAVDVDPGGDVRGKADEEGHKGAELSTWHGTVEIALGKNTRGLLPLRDAVEFAVKKSALDDVAKIDTPVALAYQLVLSDTTARVDVYLVRKHALREGHVAWHEVTQMWLKDERGSGKIVDIPRDKVAVVEAGVYCMPEGLDDGLIPLLKLKAGHTAQTAPAKVNLRIDVDPLTAESGLFDKIEREGEDPDQVCNDDPRGLVNVFTSLDEG